MRDAHRLHYNALRAALGAGLPFDDACAAAFQTVVELTRVDRDSKGRVIGLMIAATAIVYQADLVTHNPKDFAGPGSVLKVVEV
ncbi:MULTISPECIES: type II toxin-antitoxin system VapC family toxin [unclassified Frondihabitans]|uniref:type II toxin-antitoxin system VapC family toxin n=1 Tax=unclassified Frondihabitans TaxID=2626248 RepID=UPI000F50CE5E|nr:MULTISPECIES: type II toxin-antitoxin system VapC family toxin [unclassified Frondihabitans]